MPGKPGPQAQTALPGVRGRPRIVHTYKNVAVQFKQEKKLSSGVSFKFFFYRACI